MSLTHAQQHLAAGRTDQALAAARQHLRRRPSDSEALKLIARIHLTRCERPQAVFALERAGAAGDAEAWYLLGREHRAAKDPRAAAAAFERSVAINPREPVAWGELAECRVELDDEAGAADALDNAAANSPGHPDVLRQRLRVLLRLGDHALALDAARDALAAFPDDALTLHACAYAMNNLPGVSEPELAVAHRRLGEVTQKEAGPAREPASFPNAREPERPLRIGVLSCDLRRHSCAYFLLDVLAHFERDAMPLYLYSTAAVEDDFSARFKSVGTWRSCGGLSSRAMANQVSQDQIDIMVDLAGWTAPGHMRALAMRLAPLQVSYLGYPNTTGLPTIDARIVDEITDPEGADVWATERLVRLPRCFVAFSRHEIPVPEVGERGRGVTFGSFNAASKITPEVMRCWATVLATVADSRLLLKRHALGEPAIRRHRAVLAAAGVDPDRVEIAPFTDSTAEHLAMYAGVDVALDPFPYNGTTTTCEALAMGVPVVTLCGSGHRSRVGASILRACGRGGWIAETPEAFTRIATELVRSDSTARTAREELASQFASSPVCDGRAMAVALTSALRQVWREHCR